VNKSVNINEALLQEALQLDNQINIDSLVENALREYIQRRKRLKILDLFGTIDYDEDYDYKQQRNQTKRLPFDVVIPNKTTEEVFKDTDAGRNLVQFDNADDMFKKLGI